MSDTNAAELERRLVADGHTPAAARRAVAHLKGELGGDVNQLEAKGLAYLAANPDAPRGPSKPAEDYVASRQRQAEAARRLAGGAPAEEERVPAVSGPSKAAQDYARAHARRGEALRTGGLL